MTLPSNPPRIIGVVPLIGRQLTDDSQWTGALFAKLLGEHLHAAGLRVLEHNQVARRIVSDRHQLPLSREALQALQAALGTDALIHGWFSLDGDARMFGVELSVLASGIAPTPVEASTPVSGFGRFVERLTLVMFERLQMTINDAVRQKVKQAPRPASFEAFRQLAHAQAAWSRGQKELALTDVTSALALDPDYEEAACLEVAIAREANDTSTTRDAFHRWARITAKKGRHLESAEQVMMLGHWLAERGEWDEAARAYEEALSVFQRQHDEAGQARSANNLANLDLLRGKTQAAIKVYRRGLRVFEAQPGARADAAITLLNLAQAHKQLGQRNEALLAVEQAMTLAQQDKDTRLEAHALATRGAIYDDMGEWIHAGDDLNRAASLFDILADETSLAIVRESQALLLKHQGNYSQAEPLLLQALSSFERHPDPHKRAVALLNLADLYARLNLHTQAWNYAEQARKIFERLQSGLLDQTVDLLESLEEQGQTASISSAAPLYSEENLYDNVNEFDADDGGDEDVNSGVGRTPMM
jgi:tetratricopeptide (TPR) repeat protein